MIQPFDWASLRRDLAGTAVEDEPRQATATPAASAGQGWDALRRDLAATARGPEPAVPTSGPFIPTQGPPVSGRGSDVARRFPGNVPTYDRFGEPTNEAARDIETARGATAPEGTESTAERARLFGRGAVLSMGLPFKGLSPEEARDPATQAAATRYGPAAVRRVQTMAAQPGTPPGERSSFGRELFEQSPLGIIPGLFRRDPEAFGGLAGMVAQGAAVGGLEFPGREMVRGTTSNIAAADAFRTLGLDPATATARDVQSAYLKVALRTHPDVPVDVRVQRGGPADPLVAAQQFGRAQAAKEAALNSLAGRPPVSRAGPPPPQQPGTEEVAYRQQQAQQPRPAGPIPTPATDAARAMSDEELARHPLGRTPPVEQSAAAQPGVPEPLPADVVARERARQPSVAGAPQAAAAPGQAKAPGPVVGQPEAAVHPALAPEARITFQAADDDPLKASKEKLAKQVAGDGPSFAPIARMRETGATDAQIAAHLESKGVMKPKEWVPLARTMFKIPQPGGQPVTEMPVPRETSAVEPEAGAPHDQAAVQEGLFGEKTLQGKEQAELLPETAGQPTAKLKPTKIGAEEVGRVKREGAEPEGERPMELEGQGAPIPASENIGHRVISGGRGTFRVQDPGGQIVAKGLAKAHAEDVAAALNRGETPPEVTSPKTKGMAAERVGPATYTAESGKVYEGITHDQALAKAAKAGEPELKGYPEISRDEPHNMSGLALEDRMGFRLLPSRRVVGRDEAGDIAERQQQITAEGKAERADLQKDQIPTGLDALHVKGVRPKAEAAGLIPAKRLARHAELTKQIARDKEIMGANLSQSIFKDVGAHMGQPGQKFLRTNFKGPGYAARGRVAQAEKRLADLEKTMSPEELATARERAKEIAGKTASETVDKLEAERQGKSKAYSEEKIERGSIEHEELSREEAEELAREQKSDIPVALRREIIDKLIDYGETREELEKLPPTDLAKRALEGQFLSPADESKLLDVVWPTMGGLLIRGRGVQPLVPPERGLRDAFRRAVYPEKRGPEAVTEARLLRRAIGEYRRAIAVDRETLKAARRLPGVDLRTPEGIEWYDRSERPDYQDALKGLSPEMRAVTELIRSMYAPIVRDTQALGKLVDPIENYLAHGWLRPEDEQKARAAMYEGQSKRPFAGSKAFLKQRTWPLLVDGLRAGAKPITPNGVDLNLWKMQQMRKFNFAEQHLRAAAKEGLATQPAEGEHLPNGWRRLQDRTLQSWAMPEPAARILDNYLSSGLRGNEIVDAYLGAANSLVMAKLGLSFFHAAFSTYTGAISRVALAFREARTGRFPVGAPTAGGTIGGMVGALAGGVVAGAPGALFGGALGSTAGRLLQRGLGLRAAYLKPGSGTVLEQRLADMLERSGGQHKMPDDYLTTTKETVSQALRRGKIPTAIAKSLLLALRVSAWPTMQFYVPLIKLGAFANMMQSELERLGPLTTDAELDKAAQDVWHSIDNRFGQVSYDTRFWNNAVKHALMGTIQAVGWDAGTIDELGGGVKDALRGKGSHRFDFLIALPLTVAALNIILQLAMTGEGPSSVQDVFEPRDGTKDEFGNPNRVTPATYMKDVIGFGRHPIRTTLGKLNPILGFFQGLVTNRDFYGNKWRNENDPASQQLKQLWDYLKTEVQPISFSNVQEAARRGETGGRRLLPAVGVTPASREAIRTPAENMIFDIMRSHGGGRTPEQVERGRERQLGGPTGEARIVQMFRHLAPEDRQHVYDVANDHEKALFRPYLAAHLRPYKR